MFKFRSLTLAAAAVVFSTASAFAGPTYTFSSSVGVQPSNVGIITLSQVDANTVKVLVDLIDTTLPAPQYGFLNTGGPHTPFAFTISGTETGVAATFIQPAGGTFSFGLLTLNLAGGSNTPYGTYGIAIDSSAGNGSSNAYFGDLEFNLTRTSGLSTDDFIKNGDSDCPGGGCYFSADLTNGSNTGSQAWYTRSTTTTSVPAPAAIGLLGLGLLGLGLAARRRRAA